MTMPRSEWFRCEDVEFSRLEELEGCLDRFARRELDGVLIRNLYPESYMREVSERIERHDPPFYIFPPVQPASVARQRQHLYGITLAAADRCQPEYFRVAPTVRDHCLELFQDDIGFEEKIREIFGVLSGGRPVVLPETPDGQIYMPTTVRILPEGSGIDLHADNHLGHHPAYDHLKTVCDVNHQLSFFMTLSTPEEGGELIIYQRQWSAEDDIPGEYVVAKDRSMIEGCESLALKPGPGDLILFAGGRFFHQVAKAVGPHPRRTIGGFMADAFEGDSICYWS